MHLLLTSLLGTALAADIEPTFNAELGASYWRVGASLNLRPGVELALWNQEGSALFEDTYLSLQGDVLLSPAFYRAGARLRFAPIAVFDATAYYYRSSYFGNFQTLIGFSDPSENYGYNDELELLADNRGPGGGWHAGGQANLKARVGDVIVVLNGDWSHWDIAAEGIEGDYVFEREQEVMIALGGDQILVGNGVLLYEWDADGDDGKYMRVGTLTTYRQSAATEDSQLRSGLLATLSTHEEKWNHVFVLQAHLDDRTYTEPFPPFFGYKLKYTR